MTSIFFLVLIVLGTIAFRNRSLDPPLFDFILLMLVAFRLTHLLVYDAVMDFIRDYFEKKSSRFGKSMSELVHCPWCTGTWTALIVAFIYFLTPHSRFFILVLALAGAGILIEITARLIWKKIPQ